MICDHYEKFNSKRTGFEPGGGGQVSWFRRKNKVNKAQRKMRENAHDNTWRNRTVHNVVPCTLFVTCFWDILVDPLQRMLQSNGKMTELKTAAVFAILFFFLVGSGHAGASPLSYKRNSPGGKQYKFLY
ncbi:hypothetical protein RUM44_011160 [Polyplax serrata]|uniref:Transmembrane protein n=1 Tax=Polyplax serrata TaxID=468196 RepID=A0ABR1APD3_POLSC